MFFRVSTRTVSTRPLRNCAVSTTRRCNRAQTTLRRCTTKESGTCKHNYPKKGKQWKVAINCIKKCVENWCSYTSENYIGCFFRGSNNNAAHELTEAKSRIESLISKVQDLENANLALNQKIADMKQEMEDQRSSFRSQLASKDDEIKRLLDELANQVRQNIAICIDRLLNKNF